MSRVVRGADQRVVEDSGVSALPRHQQLAGNAVVAVLQVLYGARGTTRELQQYREEPDEMWSGTGGGAAGALQL